MSGDAPPPANDRVARQRNAAETAASAGLVLALCLALPGFLASAAIAARAPFSALPLYIAAAAVAVWTWQAERRDAPYILAISGLIVAASLVVAAQFFDLSFDGLTYHQEAVRALARGWNPVWDPGAADGLVGGMFVGSLPKAAWLLEAMLYRATGSLECAKGVHVIALTAAFLLAWPALERAGVERRTAVVGAALATANPIAVPQVLSFQLDGIVASSLVVLVSLAVLAWRDRRRRWIVAFVLVAAFTANLKFPAAVTVVLLLAIASALAIVRDRGAWRRVLVIGACIGIATGIEGINPYVTNTIRHGNPAYPAAGPHAISLVMHGDSVLLAENRVVQMTRTVFSRSSDVFDEAPRLKIPFSIHAMELSAFTTLDTRIGGMGPWFGGAVIVAAAMLLAGVLGGVPRARWLAAMSATVALTTLAVPYGFLVRYAPQLWLVCIPPLFIWGLRARSTKLLAVVLGVNTLMVSAVCLGSQLLNERLHRAQLRSIAAAAGGGEVTVSFYETPFVNVDLHFAAYGIRSRIVGSPECVRPARLLRTHAMMCLPGGRSPAPEPDVLRAVAPLLEAVGIR